MESLIKQQSTKRFVIQDSFTKVTSDGEPHGTLTMIAGLSGLLAAVVILAVLVSLVGCKKGRRSKHCKNCPSSMHSSESTEKISCSISQSEGGSTPTAELAAVPRHLSISCISNGNLEGNLNSAFVGSELTLAGSMRKSKKGRSRPGAGDETNAAKETIIDMERY